MVEIQSEFVYIYRSDLEKLNRGMLCFVFIEEEGEEDAYTLIHSSSLKVIFKIDDNKYEVVRNNI